MSRFETHMKWRIRIWGVGHAASWRYFLVSEHWKPAEERQTLFSVCWTHRERACLRGLKCKNRWNIYCLLTSQLILNGNNLPDPGTLKDGWMEQFTWPKITYDELERYLLKSSSRTLGKQQQDCYRQFPRGYNFFRNGLVFAHQIHHIDKDSVYCYVRANCYASMKQGE